MANLKIQLSLIAIGFSSSGNKLVSSNAFSFTDVIAVIVAINADDVIFMLNEN